MAEPATSTRPPFWKKPFALWVIFGGLLYFGLVLLTFLVPFLTSNPGAFFSNIFGVLVLVFIALFVVAAFLSLKGKGWTMALAAAVSIVFLLLFSSFLIPSLTNPADPGFAVAMSGIPALLLVAIFSILMLLKGRKGIVEAKYLASAKSGGGLFVIAVVGFVVGGLVVGNLAATQITRILGGGGQGADIRIVPNAMAGPSGGVPQPFKSATFTIAAGGTVTWFNADTVQHTVTSNTTGLFDSGLMDPGTYWSHTFTTPGTYEYHCTPHSTTMWGKVVVTP